MRRSTIAMLTLVLMASCVAPPVDAPPPRPVAPVTVAPPPPAIAAPAPVQPGAVEPGTWFYQSSSGRDATQARFGATPTETGLVVECLRDRRVVALRVLRTNPSAPPATATLRASTTAKAVPVSGGSAFGVIELAAAEPILDALAFSRGKFGISVDGRERWYPAWPELTRVIEDCRA